MLSGEQRTLSKSDMQFSYRHSFLSENPHLFLISATFDLSQKTEKYHSDVDNIDFRENKQPKGNCCGSFFKNPNKENSAGSLIERVGLKGYRHGGAYWSPLHANFLMSDGPSCLPSDLIELVRMTQDRVKKETGIELVNEVRIIEN
jgi:UDP-N-acetylmuramate dehydrogenase